MGILSSNYAQIVPGALISASYVSDIYDVLLGSATESINLRGSVSVNGPVSISGSATVNGSVTVTSGIYGSLVGNASTATSASYAINCTTASYIAANKLTITPSNPLPTNVLTGTFAVSASSPPKPYFWDGTTWNALY
jgi:hypothetical protein